MPFGTTQPCCQPLTVTARSGVPSGPDADHPELRLSGTTSTWSASVSLTITTRRSGVQLWIFTLPSRGAAASGAGVSRVTVSTLKAGPGDATTCARPAGSGTGAGSQATARTGAPSRSSRAPASMRKRSVRSPIRSVGPVSHGTTTARSAGAGSEPGTGVPSGPTARTSARPGAILSGKPKSLMLSRSSQSSSEMEIESVTAGSTFTVTVSPGGSSRTCRPVPRSTPIRVGRAGASPRGSRSVRPPTTCGDGSRSRSTGFGEVDWVTDWGADHTVFGSPSTAAAEFARPSPTADSANADGAAGSASSADSACPGRARTVSDVVTAGAPGPSTVRRSGPGSSGPIAMSAHWTGPGSPFSPGVTTQPERPIVSCPKTQRSACPEAGSATSCRAGIAVPDRVSASSASVIANWLPQLRSAVSAAVIRTQRVGSDGATRVIGVPAVTGSE
ncbi:hypothetical protein TSOC111612_21580 [Tsukamurella ocularis]